MIKVLHTADLHLGWENYSHPTEEGLSSCLVAFCETLDEIINIAIDEAVDLVAIAGDLYKMRDPSQTYQHAVAEFVAEISQDLGIPIVMVPGNHDLPGNPTKAGTTDIFTTLDARKVVVLDTPDVYPIETQAGPIHVASMPWLRLSDTAGEDLGDAYREVAQNLASQSRALDRWPDAPVILVGHLTVADAKPGSEAGMMLGKDPIIPVKALALAPFDAVMLGHIHNGQVWDDQYPVVAYCGSPQALDFTDEGDQKHVLIWQIEKGKTTLKDVPLKSARKFLTHDIEIDGMFTTPENVVVWPFETPDGAVMDMRGHIIRVNVTVPKHLASQIDNNAIHKALDGAAWVQINKKVLQDNAPVKDVATLAGMSPIQALEKYCESRTLTPGFREEVLNAATTLMKGAER